ncbi:MAG: hypothetical protein IPK81_15745 [Rhodospirillales bacterium]|nr:MAG: hypothetical protein IPK81_15745 [Rhodospirillales bacterium]
MRNPSDAGDKALTPASRDAAVGRRRALAKLGLAAGAAYAAPTLIKLDRRAYAAATPCPPPGWPGPRPPSCPHK